MTCLPRWITGALLVAFLTSCAAPTKGPRVSRGAENQMRRLEVAGAKIGDTKTVLRRFPQAKKIPFGRKDIETYEIYKPNPQISMLVLSFRDGRLWKMELRYFDGPTERTLRGAGGWNGLRDFLIKRYGPPVKTGPNVPQLNALPGLNSGYAKFNGVWDFPRIPRQMHFITLADAKGGVGVITFIDSTPRKKPPAPGTTSSPLPPIAPNPGF